MSNKLASFGRYGVHVIQFPSGRFGFVGTLPEVLCVEKKQPNGLPYKTMPSFETEAEAIKYFEDNKHLVK